MAAARTARILLLACLATAIGCDTPAPNPLANVPLTPPPGLMSAVVDGNAWSAGGIAGSPAAAAYTVSPADTSIFIVGHRVFANGSGSFIKIFARSFVGAGSYSLSLETNATSGARATYAFYTSTNDTTGYATDASRTGTLIVSSFDLAGRNIRGTFSFTGYHAGSVTATTVTSGSFDVSF